MPVRYIKASSWASIITSLSCLVIFIVFFKSSRFRRIPMILSCLLRLVKLTTTTIPWQKTQSYFRLAANLLFQHDYSKSISSHVILSKKREAVVLFSFYIFWNFCLWTHTWAKLTSAERCVRLNRCFSFVCDLIYSVL